MHVFYVCSIEYLLFLARPCSNDDIEPFHGGNGAIDRIRDDDVMKDMNNNTYVRFIVINLF